MLHISTIFFQPVSQTYNYEVWSSYRRKYIGLLCSKEYLSAKTLTCILEKVLKLNNFTFNDQNLIQVKGTGFWDITENKMGAM